MEIGHSALFWCSLFGVFVFIPPPAADCFIHCRLDGMAAFRRRAIGFVILPHRFRNLDIAGVVDQFLGHQLLTENARKLLCRQRFQRRRIQQRLRLLRHVRPHVRQCLRKRQAKGYSSSKMLKSSQESSFALIGNRLISSGYSSLISSAPRWRYICSALSFPLKTSITI